jgi:outer membrane protein assembly factor BamD
LQQAYGLSRLSRREASNGVLFPMTIRLNPGEMAAYRVGQGPVLDRQGQSEAIPGLRRCGGFAAPYLVLRDVALRDLAMRDLAMHDDDAEEALGLDFMSTKRMALAHQRLSNRWSIEALARLLRVAAGLAVAGTVLGACSGATELWDKVTQKDDTFAEQPAEQLYNEGLFLTNEKSDPKGGAKKFEEVDRQHPYSDLARKSLLMSAYAYYQANDYDSCIGAATRYVTLHPGSPDAAYAQYLIAASHYDQITDVTRDQTRTEKAMAALEEVVRKYPTSEYAVSAKQKLEAARDQLAGKEMNVGRYNLQKRNYTGAINRFKTVVTQYQTTRHVEEALARLTEAYMAIGIVGEAQTAAAVLGHNFPDSPWYKDAYNLVKSGGVEPNENQDSWLSKTFRKLGIGKS